MTERIPQSTAKLVVFKAYLASDHVTEATGKTIAITISKNGGAFGNPNAGATNATEISSGWYKVSLDTTDTNTLGPVAVRGAVATVDDVGILIEVVSATTGGATNLDAAISSRMATYTQPTGFLAASFPTDPADQSLIIAATDTLATLIGDVPTNAELATALGTADDAVLAAVATVQTSINDLPTNAELATALATADDAVLTAIDELPTNAELATALGTADDAVLAQVALVKAKTDNLPSDPADQSLMIAATDALATLIGDVPTNAELATALGTADDAVLAQVALVKTQTDKLTFDGDNHVLADARKLSTSSTAADNLEDGALCLVRSTCAAGSSTTSVVTNLTEGTDDHYNGRALTFKTGALAGQATGITDYNGTTKTLTVVALTEAPADTDAFVIS